MVTQHILGIKQKNKVVSYSTWTKKLKWKKVLVETVLLCFENELNEIWAVGYKPQEKKLG